jgi:hypothetical protein
MRKEELSSSITQEATAVISAAYIFSQVKHLDHPSDALAAEHIGKDEKRAILGADKAVTYDEILDALKALDRCDAQSGEQGSSSSFSVRRSHRRRPGARRFHGVGLCSYWNGGRHRQFFET